MLQNSLQNSFHELLGVDLVTFLGILFFWFIVMIIFCAVRDIDVGNGDFLLLFVSFQSVMTSVLISKYDWIVLILMVVLWVPFNLLFCNLLYASGATIFITISSFYIAGQIGWLFPGIFLGVAFFGAIILTYARDYS